MWYQVCDPRRKVAGCHICVKQASLMGLWGDSGYVIDNIRLKLNLALAVNAT